MSPGESEISVPLPHPPGLPWGVPPAVGVVGPEDPRPKPLQSWREVWRIAQQLATRERLLSRLIPPY